jgi:hypothetical protein
VQICTRDRSITVIDRLKYHHISAGVLCDRSAEEEEVGSCLGAQNKLGDTIAGARGETGKWMLYGINIGQY